MHDPWMTRALRLDGEREMNRRYEIARQLREAKVEHKLQRQRQLRFWVTSLLRWGVSPLAPYSRCSVRDDRRPEIMQLVGNKVERGTPPSAALPDTVAAISVSRRMRQYGDQDSAGRLVVTCERAGESSTTKP